MKHPLAPLWLAVSLTFALSCRPSPEAYCKESCESLAKCEPLLMGLEAQCRMDCENDFEDEELITDTCQTATQRHPIDARGPHTADSVIDHGLCLISLGCPPEEPDPEAERDSCEDTRQICLDALSAEERCIREFEIDRFDCREDVNACYREIPNNPQLCSDRLMQCYDLADQSRQTCIAEG